MFSDVGLEVAPAIDRALGDCQRHPAFLLWSLGEDLTPVALRADERAALLPGADTSSLSPVYRRMMSHPLIQARMLGGPRLRPIPWSAWKGYAPVGFASRHEKAEVLMRPDKAGFRKMFLYGRAQLGLHDRWDEEAP
jgi:hypothetical protein